MNSNVRQAIRYLLSNTENSGKLVRFSISIDEIDDKKLKYMAEKLRLSKSNLVATLLKAAIDDLEDEMGLDKNDPNSGYVKAVWGESLIDLDDYKI